MHPSRASHWEERGFPGKVGFPSPRFTSWFLFSGTAVICLNFCVYSSCCCDLKSVHSRLYFLSFVAWSTECVYGFVSQIYPISICVFRLYFVAVFFRPKSARRISNVFTASVGKRCFPVFSAMFCLVLLAVQVFNLLCFLPISNTVTS